MSARSSSLSRKKNKYSVAELFCGCGGFSHGFALTQRFNVVFGNDVKREALNTFKLNHRNGLRHPLTMLKDIRAVADSDLQKLIEESANGSLDCLIGGPPCQGFSQMRRTEERKGSELVRFGGYNRLDQDSRNDLVLRFLEVAQVLHPKVIVIENVPQMLTHHYGGTQGGLVIHVERLLEEMGYSVNYKVLNAANYGVPQLRERAIILASRLGEINLPTPRYGDKLKPYITVRQAIADLPVPVAQKLAEPKLVPYEDLNGLRNEYLQIMRGKNTFASNHFTRNYQDRIHQIIREMCAGETWDSATQRMQKQYTDLIKSKRKNGESESQTKARLIKTRLINPVFYKNYYWSAYTRLDWESPALTITANANFLGSGRFTHPDQDRGITMREAARLQSFDDDFIFYTSEEGSKDRDNIGIGMDMIGEAVPPLLGQAIADEVAKHLDHQLPQTQMQKQMTLAFE